MGKSGIRRIVLVTIALFMIVFIFKSERGPSVPVKAETVGVEQAATLMFSMTERLDDVCRNVNSSVQRRAFGEAEHVLGSDELVVTAAFCSMPIGPVTLRQSTEQSRATVEFEVRVASDGVQRQAGFQHIGSEVMKQTGILFVFPSPISGAFHMCNVIEPLWILWFQADGALLDAVRMEPDTAGSATNCDKVYAPQTAGQFQYALEVGEDLSEALLTSLRGFSDSEDPLKSRVDPGDMRHLQLVIGSWERDRHNQVVDVPTVDIPEDPLEDQPISLRLEPIMTGLNQPLEVVAVPGERETIAVVEKTGRVQIVKNGRLSDRPLLDLSGSVSQGSEQGLLSLAFHPEYDQNNTFYVNFTDKAGDTQIVSYKTMEDTLVADEQSAQTVLSIAQPASNHNGGMIAFGPGGHLYIATGDGGRAGDPWNNAQNLQSLLGKLLRIDVNPAYEDERYYVPADNPFVNDPNALPEIWAFGLRNPWRFSFDRVTGDLYIADVGQNKWEEINVSKAGQGAGANYGWNKSEGFECYVHECTPSDFTLPKIVYGHDHEGGCSITGGHVYRGNRIPLLYGAYVFGDFCSGRIWAVWPDGQSDRVVDRPQQPAESAGPGDVAPWNMTELIQTELSISGFGEDGSGELYVTDLASGAVYRLDSGPID